MKFKDLFTRKKIWIPISIGITIILVILFFVLRNRNYHSPETGVAAFYKYSANITDSLLDLMTEEQKAKSLIYFSNENDSIADLAKKTGTFSGYFYLELKNMQILEKFAGLKENQKFIKAVSENLLSSFSDDSTFYVSSELLSTINDSLILSRYFSYQTDLIKEKKINALVINLNLPEVLDSVSVRLIANKVKIKLDILHKNNILSFISVDYLPNAKIQNNSQNLKLLMSEIFKGGLCGIIVNKTENLSLFDVSKFDGLIIVNLEAEQIPDEALINSADAFLSSSENSQYLLKLTDLIKKTNSKESLFMKSSKVLRSSLWANQKNAEKDTCNKVLNIRLMESNITEASITILKNDKDLVPLTNINQKIHLLIATNDNASDFISTISKYTNNYTVSYFDFSSGVSPSIPNSANTVAVLYKSELRDSLPVAIIKSLTDFSKNKIFINCGKLNSALLTIPANTIIQVYNSNSTGYSFAAQLIFGGIAANGTLSTWLNDSVSYGYGIKTKKTRLKYSMPEDAGLNAETLLKIDSIVNYAISTGAFPGCQVYVARKGIVVYEKSFGYLDYSKSNAVDKTDMYDLASLTKICATTCAMMKMVEQGKIRLDDKLEKYFRNTKIDYGKITPDTVTIIDTVSVAGLTDLEIRNMVAGKDTIHVNDTLIRIKQEFITKTTPSSNIFQVPVRALLVHQSGISPSLPILPYIFYEDSYAKWRHEEDKKAGITDTQDKKYPKQEAWNFYYSNKWVKDSAEVKIADNMYLQKRWQDTLYEDIKRLGTFNRNTYQYTDMNMILAQAIIDSVNKMTLDRYVKREFYESLGMKYTTYLPLDYNIPRNRIAPTEYETGWRKQVIHGNVHDPSAAMLGGISGNAGLYSTASDLGILGQMWLNGGTYGGTRYLNESTIRMFAATQPENHRGLGFDKAAPRNLNAPSAPASTYGHTGFTGGVMWIDPENEIVYIFLSNRLHPNVKNWQILGQKVLQNVHQVVYDAIEE